MIMFAFATALPFAVLMTPVILVCACVKQTKRSKVQMIDAVFMASCFEIIIEYQQQQRFFNEEADELQTFQDELHKITDKKKRLSGKESLCNRVNEN